MSSILWLCFGISGAAALALEVLWMRSAGLVLETSGTIAEQHRERSATIAVARACR